SFSKIIIIIICFFILYGGVSDAQMPDWTVVKDRDGNKFFFDANGKIWTSGEPEFERRPVSIEGMDYYLNQGIELIREFYIDEGLTLLKSIMCMPVASNKIYEAQNRAREELDVFRKKQGDRYDKYSISSSVLLYREGKTVTVVNDHTEYSIKIPASFRIIRRKIRQEHNYQYSGLLIGVSFKDDIIKEKDDYNDFDMLIAVDSEIFSKTIQSADKIEMNMRNRLGSDTFKREVLEKSLKKIIYIYKDKAAPYYSGYECFYIKDNKGYNLRTICSKENFGKYNREMSAVVKSFSL
ncbi:MAG: hypothetical protein MUC95_10040, partial [Spirochaetes bacterium]|nr:hypothetical protein [Spirochaetota bacterium]